MAIIKILVILVGMLLDIDPDVYGLYVTTDKKKNQATDYQIYKCHIGNHGSKSNVLLQVLQDVEIE